MSEAWWRWSAVEVVGGQVRGGFSIMLRKKGLEHSQNRTKPAFHGCLKHDTEPIFPCLLSVSGQGLQLAKHMRTQSLQN